MNICTQVHVNTDARGALYSGEPSGVGVADAEAVSVGVGGDERVAKREGGGFQRDGEAERCPVVVDLVDVVVGGIGRYWLRSGWRNQLFGKGFGRSW